MTKKQKDSILITVRDHLKIAKTTTIEVSDRGEAFEIHDAEDGVTVPYSHAYLVFEELKSLKPGCGEDGAWYALAGVVKALEDLEDAAEAAL